MLMFTLSISCFSQFSHSVVSDSLWPHGLQHARLSCPSPTPGACSNSCPLSRWCCSTISLSVSLFSSCLQSFPANQGLFQWVSSLHQVAKVLESSFSISPSNEHSGLISITSNLPWFMNVTFQVPIQYCSSQRPSLLPSPITSTAGRSFLFGSVSSFFLELFLHSSPVACWAPTDLGRSSFNVCLFAFLYCSWGSQGKNTEVVCHSLLQWTMFFLNSPLWPIHPGWSYMAWLIVSMSLLLIVASQPAYRFLRGH